MRLHNVARSGAISPPTWVCVSDGPYHRPSWTVTIAGTCSYYYPDRHKNLMKIPKQVDDRYFIAAGPSKSSARDEAARLALDAFGFLRRTSYEPRRATP